VGKRFTTYAHGSKSAEDTDELTVFFLGSLLVKAASKMLVKSTPRWQSPLEVNLE